MAHLMSFPRYLLLITRVLTQRLCAQKLAALTDSLDFIGLGHEPFLVNLLVDLFTGPEPLLDYHWGKAPPLVTHHGY